MDRNKNSILLSTKRLILRYLTKDDIDDMCRLDGDPEVMKFITHGIPRTREQVQGRLDKVIDQYKTNKDLGIYAACLKDGSFIGWGELYFLEDSGLVEVGYRLLKKYWNQGYATEIAKALVDYGFNTVGLKKIVGVTYPDNLASKKVLMKAGLVEKGVKFYYGTDLSYFEIKQNE